MGTTGGYKVFSGNANRALTQEICNQLGCDPGSATIDRFSDGEFNFQITENVRGADVFIVQPTCPPTDAHLMELLVMLDAFRRSSAERVTAVIPYFGYARSDKKARPRVPIASKLVSNLIATAGADRVLTMDLHAAQIQGFFDIPVDHLYAAPLSSRDIQERFNGRDLMIVSPDVGGVLRARLLATRLNRDLAIIDKRRERAGHSEVMNVIGDVEGRDCVLIDDIVDSGGTHCNAANALMEHGARSASAWVTHGVLSGGAVARVASTPLEMMTITDSI